MSGNGTSKSCFRQYGSNYHECIDEQVKIPCQTFKKLLPGGLTLKKVIL